MCGSWSRHFEQPDRNAIGAIGQAQAFTTFGVIPADFNLIGSGHEIVRQGELAKLEKQIARIQRGHVEVLSITASDCAVGWVENVHEYLQTLSGDRVKHLPTRLLDNSGTRSSGLEIR